MATHSRVRLNEEEYRLIQEYRMNKSQKRRGDSNFDVRLSPIELEHVKMFREKHSALVKECEEKGIEVEDVKHYWYKSEGFSLFVKGNQGVTYKEVRQEIVDSMCEHAYEYKKIDYKPCADPHALVIDPADIHIGKICSSFQIGKEYNSQIAIKRVKEGVRGLLAEASHKQIDKIIFITGNDILHVDNNKSTTTNGTHQHMDSMWFDAFMMAKRLLVEVLEECMSVAPVEVVYNPSNHDYVSGFMLLDSISSWFHKCEDVIFHNDMAHRKYVQYGKNLIGTTHGDGAKEIDLPRLMAEEASEFWHECLHRYIYTHHVHHKHMKGHGSVHIESMSSPSEADSWHHIKGYEHAPRQIEAFLHHPKKGRTATFTHTF
ncbi:MAG: hypothetical protein COA88_14585 [Kordia sp.]|nr:MAG: hypothetical protein COA88_14585 [Kordia sp.]